MSEDCFILPPPAPPLLTEPTRTTEDHGNIEIEFAKPEHIDQVRKERVDRGHDWNRTRRMLYFRSSGFLVASIGSCQGIVQIFDTRSHDFIMVPQEKLSFNENGIYAIRNITKWDEHHFLAVKHLNMLGKSELMQRNIQRGKKDFYHDEAMHKQSIVCISVKPPFEIVKEFVLHRNDDKKGKVTVHCYSKMMKIKRDVFCLVSPYSGIYLVSLSDEKIIKKVEIKFYESDYYQQGRDRFDYYTTFEKSIIFPDCIYVPQSYSDFRIFRVNFFTDQKMCEYLYGTESKCYQMEVFVPKNVRKTEEEEEERLLTLQSSILYMFDGRSGDLILKIHDDDGVGFIPGVIDGTYILTRSKPRSILQIYSLEDSTVHTRKGIQPIYKEVSNNNNNSNMGCMVEVSRDFGKKEIVMAYSISCWKFGMLKLKGLENMGVGNKEDNYRSDIVDRISLVVKMNSEDFGKFSIICCTKSDIIFCTVSKVILSL